MSILIRIPADHMRFVPAHRQSDDMAAILTPAKWPVEFVLISNAADRETHKDQSRIQGILALAIRDVCQMTTAQTKFFPLTSTTSTGALPHTSRHPTRPIPRCPAICPHQGC